MSTMLNDPRLIKDQPGNLWQTLRNRLRGDLGPLPVLLGLAVIWIVFQSANDKFLTPLNLTNLMVQITALGTLSVGIVLILLLGEVDLSVGVVSGLCAAVIAVLNVKGVVINNQQILAPLPGPAAVLIGIFTGFLIGLFQGFWITKLRVPAFIVTLAGNLGWTGALLFVLGNTGTVNLRDKFILGLAGTFFKRDIPSGDVIGWALAIGFVLLYTAGLMWERQRRAAAGLMANPLSWVLLQAGFVGAGALAAMALFNADRGLPSAFVWFIGLILLFDFITTRTVFGRHLFAVGGNAEAARRASINVDWIRIVVYGLASMLAAIGGILAASRLLAVNQSSGSGDLLLNAIAAAVIGGTSLFGGRGSVWSSLLGAVVIGSISNGMDLLALPSPIKLMITAAVLLTAVTIDALARRQREAAGR